MRFECRMWTLFDSILIKQNIQSRNAIMLARIDIPEATEYIAAFPTWFWYCLEWWQTYKPAATRPPPLSNLHSRQSRFLLLIMLFTVCTFVISRSWTRFTKVSHTAKRFFENFFFWLWHPDPHAFDLARVLRRG